MREKRDAVSTALAASREAGGACAHLIAGESVQLIRHRVRQRSDEHDAVGRELALLGGRQDEARVLPRRRHHVQLLVDVALRTSHGLKSVRENRVRATTPDLLRAHGRPQRIPPFFAG